MKKLFKDFDKRFIVSLIIIITLLSAFAIAYAAKVTTEMDSKGTYGTSDTINFQGQYMFLSDLLDKYDIICCYHGGNDSHLSNSGAAVLNAGGYSTTVTDSGKNIGELTKADEGNQTALTISSYGSTPFTDSAYYAESWAWFEATEIVVTSPDNSYILAEMIAEVDPEDRVKVFYDDEYSTIQHAWWVTDDNIGNNHTTTNALYEEAEAFYSYIKKIAKSVNVDDFVETNYEFELDGEVHSGKVPAPELEYVPSYNEDANQDGKTEKDSNGNATGEDKVTVCFDTDTNTYTIGPFSIDYVEESFQKENPETPQDDRKPVRFAGITNAQLFTNLGEVDFAIKEDETNFENEIEDVPGAKWRFNFLKNQRETTDNYRFPHANEVFYIELDYIEGVTKITNLHFDFKYMNAGGRYEKLEGTYYEQTWTPNESVAEVDSWGDPYKWNYWLDLTSMNEQTAQLLAYGVIGARWYEKASLDLNVGDLDEGDEWNYEIIKEVVDKDGNQVSTTDKFVFEVYADGNLIDTVKVPANVPFKSATYKVNPGESVPTVEIKEAFTGDTAKNYRLISIDKSTEGSNKFVFKAKNEQIEKKGRISIEKRLNGNSNLEFQFKVYVDNKLYTGAGTDANGIIKIRAGETWTSDYITWTGNAPKYRVEEVNLPAGTELYAMVNSTGTLVEDGIGDVKVIAYNELDWEKGTLKIKKELVDASTATSETFTFNVKVGDDVFPVALKAGQEWSQTFSWKAGEQPPHYEVTEINIPEGWAVDRTENASGQLQPNSSASASVVTIYNKEDLKKGHVVLTKRADEEHKDLEFQFELYINGELQIIPGKTTPEGIIKIHPGEVWDSGDITWKGNAPTYEVKEVNIPAGIEQYTITNAKGILNQNEPTKVDAYNGDGWEGANISIKKVLTEGSRVGNETFSFNVRVGTENYQVTLKAGETWNQKFAWKTGTPAPDYEISEINIPDGWELVEITNKSGTLKSGTNIDVVCTNNQVEKKGKVSVRKEGTEDLNGKTFDFKLYIDNKLYTAEGTDGIIKVRVGETWTSDYITWKGKAPTYRFEEVNIPEGVELVSFINSTGTVPEGETAALAIAKNRSTFESGKLSITKVLDGNISSTANFVFKIKVGNDVFTKVIKAGQTWTQEFVWEAGKPAPEYSVEEIEIPDGYELVSIENKTGTLKNGETIKVKCINEGKEKSGNIQVKKEIETNDKIGVDNNVEFSFVVKISGTFEYEGESIVNGTKVIDVTLKPNETWTSPKVTWKGDAPTYSVTETSLPEGWVMKRISNSKGSLADGKTITVICVNEYNIKIEYDLRMQMAGIVWEDAPLNKEDKNTANSVANGLHDDSELGIQNVEVTIWKVLYSGQKEVRRTLAVAYEDNSDSEIVFPVYTGEDGIWRVNKIQVPGISEAEKAEGITRADYDVEFCYDGQNYEPTDFLVTGSAADFRKGSNARRNEYNRDSMAIEVEAEREAFNNKFATITGDTPIDSDGTTLGYSVGTDGSRTDLEYYSTDSIPSLDGNTRKISELQTRKDGYIKDEFKMSAKTSTGGLTFPFDEKYHLDYIDKIVNKIEGGMIIKYHYNATYPYLLNINLGLVKRDEAELAVTKDVYSADVVVNQKLMNYKYNEYIDFENEKYQDYLNLQLKVADANISYKLDLYESDYYYRARVYEENAAVYGALQDFYGSITNMSEQLDLDVFLTYKINVYNDSDSYLAEVKKLTDYFDEDLELVETSISRYIQEANGVNVDSETTVAKPAYVIKKGPSGDNMWSEQLNKSLEGKITVDRGTLINSNTNVSGFEVSDKVRTENGKKYYKAEIDLSGNDLTLAVGEKLEVYLTFKVKTDEAAKVLGDAVSASEDAKSYVRLGTKANIAEVGAYSTYYADSKKVAGRIDRDSAPNNVDIAEKNEKTWYEDDCDSAPIITLDLYQETRDINGMAWEDKESDEIDYHQKIGNGIYDDGERLIGNLTTEIVEKVRVKQSDGTYKEYDFVWPTSREYSFLNGKTLQDITGFDSVTLTGNTAERQGLYTFKNIPAGNYVVRFVYGDFPADTVDADGNLVRAAGVAEAQTSDDNNRKPAVYNGQDFKTTKYQADLNNEYTSEGYINDEWYNFESCTYDEDGEVRTHNSDAIDNEARRLEVIAYSRVLDNAITTVLATANNYNADHTELYKNTSMFADTARINLTIENMHSLEKQAFGNGKAGGQEEKNGIKLNYVYGKSDVNGGKGTVNMINYKYVIDAVDIGIEERSNTEIVLDKEIESITLTPNVGGTPILKAVYDINYEYNLDNETGASTYKAKVELNRDQSYGTEHLLAQNKNEEAGLQNFRYIYYDDTIAQSLNLEVKYRFTAINVGEVDRASAFLENVSKEDLLAKAQEIKDNTFIKQGDKLISVKHPNVGEYVGSIYYIGKNDSYRQSDIVVTSRVRQLIDYVDNDAVFKLADNTGLNTSWKSITADELLEGKVIDSNIIETVDGVNNILDDNGVAYTTSQRSNLIVSVDAVEGEKLANPDFIVQLVPYSASKQNGQLDKSCDAVMNLTMTRSIDSEINDDDLTYDNIAEIVRLENAVGKRDIETIAGNANPKLGEFAVSLEERDASATELITFTPPTGLNENTILTIQMLMVSVVGLAIIVVGIVVIKKTVLK